MAEITFSRPDGETCRAYLAEPTEARDGDERGLVIIHEMWGLAPPILEMAERCAKEGYRAIVPDLFRGRRARDVPEGLAMMGALDMADAVEQDLRGAAQWMKRTGPKLAALGFCMGGALSIVAAARVPELDASVCFYGVPPLELMDASAIRIPVLGHFAKLDDWCTPAKVDALEHALQASGADYELHRYDAAHAFMNQGGHGYSEAAAALAWQRTLEFLERKLA
jgi:carboxymethylenebutenolidase